MAHKTRVLAVIPGRDSPFSMPFVRRQVNSIEGHSVETARFFLRSRTSVRALWSELGRFRQRVDSFQPDIVHAHYGTVTSFFCVAGTARPVVVTFRGGDLNPAPGASRYRNSIGHLLSQVSALRASHIICVSERLKKRLWWNTRRVSVIPSGVDLALFKPISMATVRGALGWSLQRPVVLFNVRTDPVGKRLDLAEGAAQAARRRFPGLRLVVLHGDVPPDEMPLYYNGANCLLMTSDYEGSPNVIKEAIACNLPVVSVDVGDVPERLAGVTPSTIVPRDAEALGAALCRVLEAGVRSNGRGKVTDLSQERVAERVARVYESVLLQASRG